MIDLRQKEFASWQVANFGKTNISDVILGCCEEAGEMAHWYLKGKQGIRGVRSDVAKEKIADSFGDMVVFGLQVMTALELNAEKVLENVFNEVLARNWIENPTGKNYS